MIKQKKRSYEKNLQKMGNMYFMSPFAKNVLASVRMLMRSILNTFKQALQSKTAHQKHVPHQSTFLLNPSNVPTKEL